MKYDRSFFGKIVAFFFAAAMTLSCFGQQKWEEYILQLTEDSEAEAQSENLYEDLTYLSQHPENLNDLNIEQLKRLPFLSEVQIEKIGEYVAKYVPIKSIYELRLISDLDRETIDLLLPFVYVGDYNIQPQKLSMKDILKYGKNELLLSISESLNNKAGYADVSEEERMKYSGKYYLGEPFYSTFRYAFRYRDKFSFGIIGEKDAGELFWAKTHKGFDYYSVHFLLKDIGIIKTLAFGNYRINMGQGLIMNTDFRLGKNSQVLNIDKRNIGIKKHFSTDEFNYLFGAAGRIRLGKFETSMFFSNRNIDANTDETGQNILTIKKDGLHRTFNELNKKNTTRLITTGISTYYSTRHFTGGLNLLYYEFDKYMNPEEKPYNRFYFRGKDNINISIDYRYRLPGLSIFGETAIDRAGAPALLTGIVSEPSSYCKLSFLYRYYDKKYQAFYGNAFSEGAGVQNENGLYMGAEIVPVSKWKFSVYADFFRFPWLRYGIDTPSGGFDGLIQINYIPKRDMEMFLRYRYKNKDENIFSGYLNESTHTHPIDDVFTHRLRYRFSYTLFRIIKGKTISDFNLYRPGGTDDKKTGFLLSQSFGRDFEKIPISADLQLTYFNTDDYDSRVYSYEKNVLYAFSVPSFYGEGFRTVMNLKYVFRKQLTVYLRFTQTRYFDRDSIGSGAEAINGNAKSDISCLLKWSF